VSDTTVTWKDEPEEHDFPAAASYLALLAAPADVDALVKALQATKAATFKAKDVLRSSRLPLLAKDNEHVKSDLDKIEKGHRLSPVLLVRGDLRSDLPLQIADGYHRVCAAYLTDENTDVLCRIVSIRP
jgi:hypothetical protein